MNSLSLCCHVYKVWSVTELLGRLKWVKRPLEHLILCLSHSRYSINVSYYHMHRSHEQLYANPRTQPPALQRKGVSPARP